MISPSPNLPDPTVILATDRFVVIDKPSGMLSVIGKGPDKHDCAVVRVARMFPAARGPMVVHRLDMDTSGLLLVAFDAQAQRELSMQFEQRIVHKAYVALLDGVLERDHGRVEFSMRADLSRRPIQILDDQLGRPSVTNYRVLSREVDRTRVRFEPITGRSHQLRVHAATPTPRGLGAPIVGDVLYGNVGRSEREIAGAHESNDSSDLAFSINANADRLMLHAAYISFIEPSGTRRIECVSAVPF